LCIVHLQVAGAFLSNLPGASYMTLPAVGEPFYWTEASWGAALRCRTLDAVAPHLFSSRQPQLSPEVCAALARETGAQQLVTATQVHGTGVVVCREGEHPPPSAEADILVARGAGAAIAVRSADCVPVLLADRRTGAVAAVHAGWRGTRAGAAAAAVSALAREFDSRPGDLVAAIGPHVGVCCYEVGTEVVDAFAAAGFERYLIERWFPARAPARGSRARPPLHLDLGLANQDQLVLAGVPEAHIHRSNLCTAEHLDVLTSFRSEAGDAGRLVAVIRSAGPEVRR
jgi:YfiH family protein